MKKAFYLLFATLLLNQATAIEPLSVIGNDPRFVGYEGGVFTPEFPAPQDGHWLVEAGDNPVNWRAEVLAPWAQISDGTNTGTVLTEIASAQAASAITATATAAASAEHFTMTPAPTADVVFTNLDSGQSLTRKIVLLVNPPEPAQDFTGTANSDHIDLTSSSVTFYPVRHTRTLAAYEIVSTPLLAGGFWTDPAGPGRTVVTLGDDAVSGAIEPHRGFEFFGERTCRFYISSNGHLTFDAPDASRIATMDNHLSQRRIAGLLMDLDPSSGGTISWRETIDRVAVTFEDVPQFGTANLFSFQIEMFFDGAVRLSYKTIGNINAPAVTGLSSGRGSVATPTQTDLGSFFTDVYVDPPSGYYPDGPGTIAGKTYTLYNDNSSSARSFDTAGRPAWCTASPASGSIPAQGSTTVTLGATAPGAGVLAAGRVTFFSGGKGVPAVVRWAHDYQTEVFSALDLADKIVWLTPEGSPGGYRRFVEANTEVIDTSDPTGDLALADDASVEVTFPAGFEFPFFGRRYTSAFVGSNGYITFCRGDSDFSESIADHFALPRIAARFDDLNPANGGKVHWQLRQSNEIVFSWVGVPKVFPGGDNTFHIALHRDGTVRLLYGAVQAGDCIAGLSAGDGAPANFTSSDLSAAGLPDTTGPTLISSFPATGDGNFPLGIDPFIYFNEWVNPGPLGIRLFAGTTEIPNHFASQLGNSIPVWPSQPLAPGMNYEIRIAADVTDASGNPMGAPVTIPFRTCGPDGLAIIVTQALFEGGGVVGQVVLPYPAPVGGTLVNLSSSDPSVATPFASVTVPAGQRSAGFGITAPQDTLLDGLQTALFSASDGVRSGSATIYVQDDEGEAEINFVQATSSVAEGAPAPHQIGVTLQLPPGASGLATGIEVDAIVASPAVGLPASLGIDFTLSPATLTFQPGGPSTLYFNMAALDDSAIEGEEGVALVLWVGAAGAAGTTDVHTVTILDDEATPLLSIADASAPEDNGGAAASLDFVVSLDVASTNPVSFTLSTSDGALPVPSTLGDRWNAIAPGDYTATSGTFSIPPGQLTAMVSVPITPDTAPEFDEIVTATISNPVGAAIADGSAVGTIENNDSWPALTADVISPTEGAAAQVTLQRAGATGDLLLVPWFTGDGSATAPGDYLAGSGIFVFQPGSALSTTASITTVDDAEVEFAESFNLLYFALPGAAGGAAVTIDDNEPIGIGVTISGGEREDVLEAAWPGSPPSIDIFLTRPGAVALSIGYATADITAVAGEDYPASAGTVTFQPGEIRKTVTLASSTDDPFLEPDEEYAVELHDLPAGTIVLAGLTLPNGYAGAGASWTVWPRVLVGLLNDDTSTASLSLAMSTNGIDADDPDGGGVPLLAPNADITWEYVLTNDGTIALAAGDISLTDSYFCALPALDPGSDQGSDGVLSPGEAWTYRARGVALDLAAVAGHGFAVVTNSAGKLRFAGRATARVPAAGFAVTDPSHYGNPAPVLAVLDAGASSQRLRFEVELSPSSDLPVTVDFTTRDGTAVAGTDYIATSGTLTLAPGTTQSQIEVPLLSPGLFSGIRTFHIDLSNPSGAGLARASATGRITDGSSVGVVNMGGSARREPPGSTTIGGGSEVYVSPVMSQDIIVSYAVSPAQFTFENSGASRGQFWGPATPGADYTAPLTGTVTIPAGQQFAQIPITILGDDEPEFEELIRITVTGVAGPAVLGEFHRGTLRIEDDDRPVFSTPTPSPSEFTEGEVVPFRVLLSGPCPFAMVCDILLDGETGGAVAGADFTHPASNTLVFSPGETAKTISIPIIQDSLSEQTELLLFGIGNLSHHQNLFGLGTAVSIIDDDPLLLSIRNTLDTTSLTQSITGEPTAAQGSGNVSFEVLLSRPSADPVSVMLDSIDGTARAGSDYNAIVGQPFNFAPGETRKRFTLTLIGDDLVETDEFLTLALSSPTPSAINVESHRLTLHNNNGYTSAARLFGLGDPAGEFSPGVSNLQFYAHCNDGSITTGVPVLTTTGSGADRRVALAFCARVPALPDLRLEVRASPDLTTWDTIATLAPGAAAWTGPASITLDTDPINFTDRYTVSDTQTMAAAPRRFLKLRYTLLAPAAP